MVGSAVLGIVFLSVHQLSIPQLFATRGVQYFSHVCPVLSGADLPMLSVSSRVVTHTMYRVKHKNLHNLPEKGGALIVCNHVSYMDALLLSAVCPRLIRFVMEEDYAKLPPLRRFLKRAGELFQSQRRIAVPFEMLFKK